MLTAEDKKLIQQVWGKLGGAEEDVGAETLWRYRPGDRMGEGDKGVGTPWRGQRGGSAWGQHH